MLQSVFFSVICYILIKTMFIIFLINEPSNGSNLDPLGVYTYIAFITLDSVLNMDIKERNTNRSKSRCLY